MSERGCGIFHYNSSVFLFFIICNFLALNHQNYVRNNIFIFFYNQFLGLSIQATVRLYLAFTMNAIFIFLAVVTLSAAQLSNHPIVDENLDEIWANYKKIFGKIYKTKEIEVIR